MHRGREVVADDRPPHFLAGGQEERLGVGDLAFEGFEDVLGDHHAAALDRHAVPAHVLEGRFHRGDVGLEGFEVALDDGGRGVAAEGVDLLGDGAQAGGDVLVDRGEGVGGAVHRDGLAREQRGDLGLEDGCDVGVGILSGGREIQRERPHLAGQGGDFRRAAVREQAELVDLGADLRVHAAVIAVLGAHLRVVAHEGVEALGELREQVREVLLGLDGGGDGLAGGGGGPVDVPFPVDGRRELLPGEVGEGLEGLGGGGAGLFEGLEGIAVEGAVVDELLERVPDLVPGEADGAVAGGLEEEHVELADQLACGVRLPLLLHLGSLLIGGRLRLGAQGPGGVDAAEEIVHRHVVNVHVGQWHGFFSWIRCLVPPGLHADGSEVAARAPFSHARPRRTRANAKGRSAIPRAFPR
jgi:hypothetical protein